MKRFIALTAGLVFFSMTAWGWADTELQAEPECPDGRFSEHEYRGHLEYLAHDLLEGRATGDRGAALAAAYIASQFKILGLSPYSPDNGYLQPVRLRGFRTDYGSSTVSLTGRGGERKLLPLEEYCISSETESREIVADDDLLFVGYGIEAPEYKWDDFKGVDVQGKVLLVLVNDPDHEKTGFADESMSYYGRWSYKLEMARRRKAKGVVLLHHDREATYGWRVVRNSWAGERMLPDDSGDQPLQFQAWVAHAALDRALEGTGMNYTSLKEKAENRRFKPMKLPVRLKTSFRQEYRLARCSNVIGVIPGTDERLKHEAVIYTAHYDHFGIGLPDGSGDRIYNGALDNASGTAALLCLARAFMQHGEKPRRTVMIMPVTGEELGLLGSTWFVEHAPLKLNDIAVVINKDCMNHFGCRDSFSAFPVEYSDALQAVEKIGDSRGLKLIVRSTDSSGGSFRSDHFPFAARGVPAISLGMSGAFTRRSTEEVDRVRQQIGATYHQPNDEIHPAWVYDGVVQELDLLYALGRYWADGAEKPSMKVDRNNPFWATQVWYGLRPGH